MKAKIKATGEVIEVKMHFPEFEQPYFTMVDSDGVTRFTSEDLEPFEPNWQQVRIQAAIAAMPIVADDGYNVRNEQHLIAKYAVELADELVKELQKKGGQENDN